VNAAFELLRTYGLGLRFADLGEWGEQQLRSEYDPAIPEIRLNARYAQGLSPDQLGEFVTLAAGHELYHHREAIGEIARLSDRASRESAADDFARALLERSTWPA
jgi:hypothetical protein